MARVTLLCCVVLLVGAGVDEARAQAGAAKVHVDAARAAIAPKAASPNAPLHTFKALFDQVCAEPSCPTRCGPTIARRFCPEGMVRVAGQHLRQPLLHRDEDGGRLGDQFIRGHHRHRRQLPLQQQRAGMGLLNFGLDPDDIKYVLVTHAHDDRYWGAKASRTRIRTRESRMSAADWDIVAKDNSPAQFKPKKDMVITDGQKITLGDVTVTAYVTPGHTPGTLSFIIEPLWNKESVASDNERHVAAIWGGTDPSIGRQGVQYYPDGQTMMNPHRVAQAIHRSGTKAGVDVMLSPTLAHANMVREAPQLENT